MSNISIESLIQECEVNILTILLNDPSSRANSINRLRNYNFSAETGQKIWTLIKSQYELNPNFNILNIKSQLVIANRTDDEMSKIFKVLENNYISGARVDNYISLVMRHSMLDELENLGKDISANLRKNLSKADASIENEIWKIEEKVMSISQGFVRNEITPFDQIVDKTLEQIYELERLNKKITGTSSGYKNIDDITLGFQPGELIILAARPGTGKTALAINFFLNAAHTISEDEVLVFFSMEMSGPQLMVRMLSSESQVALYKLKGGKPKSDFERKSLREAERKLKSLTSRVIVDDSPDLTIMGINAVLKRIESSGKKIKLVIVDYLQLLKSDSKDKKYESRQQEVANISKMLKSYSRHYNTPVLALAQLSRKIEERKGKDARPMLSDLRESGAIEQDADLVTFIHVPEEANTNTSNIDNQNSRDALNIEFVIAKHRNGSTGEIPLVFHKDVSKIMEGPNIKR